MENARMSSSHPAGRTLGHDHDEIRDRARRDDVGFDPARMQDAEESRGGLAPVVLARLRRPRGGRIHETVTRLFALLGEGLGDASEVFGA